MGRERDWSLKKMFVSPESDGKQKKSSFLEERAKHREERDHHRKRTDAAIMIQTHVRGFIHRRRFSRTCRATTEQFLTENPDWSLASNKSIFIALRGLLFRIDAEADELLERVCRQLTANLINPAGSSSTWYCALLCSEQHATEWVRQLRKLIRAISHAMRRCRFARHAPRLSVLFTALVMLTEPSNWPFIKIKQFAALKPIFSSVVRQSLAIYAESLAQSFRILLSQWHSKTSSLLNGASLSAMFVILQRVLQAAPVVTRALLVEHIYTLPGVLNVILAKVTALTPILTQLAADLFGAFPHSKIATLSAIATLSVLGNCLELFKLTVDDVDSVRATVTVIIGLLQRIEINTGVAKSSNMSWHPVLGYCISSINDGAAIGDAESTVNIQRQLAYLWHPKLVQNIFVDVLDITPLAEVMTSLTEPSPSTTDKLKQSAKSQLERLNINPTGKVGSLITRALTSTQTTTLKQTGGRQLDYPEVKATTQSCLFYTLAMSVFVEKIRSDILTGLFCVDGFLRKLWCFICELGPSGGLYLFERILDTNTPAM